MKDIFLCTVTLGILFYPLYNCKAQWVSTKVGQGNIQCITMQDSNLFMGTSRGAFYSTNNGNDWITMGSELTDLNVLCLAINGNDIFAGTYGKGVFLSTDNGKTWEHNSNLAETQIRTISIKDQNIFVSTFGYVFCSSNYGTTWAKLLNPTDVQAFLVNDTNLIAGTSSHGIFLSTDKGGSWSTINHGIPIHYHLITYPCGGGSCADTVWAYSTISCLITIRNNLYAGISFPGADGIFLTADNGLEWNPVNNGLTSKWITSLSSNGINLFAGTSSGVFLSSNSGAIWTSIGLKDTSITSLAVCGTNLFAGSYNGMVMHRPLSEIITSVQHLSNKPSEWFSLQQNYPNPFNPTTTIRFNIPIESDIYVSVFDVLGRKLETIASGQLTKGIYAVHWNGIRYPSGIYFCSLRSGMFSETKKMILQK